MRKERFIKRFRAEIVVALTVAGGLWMATHPSFYTDLIWMNAAAISTELGHRSLYVPTALAFFVMLLGYAAKGFWEFITWVDGRLP